MAVDTHDRGRSAGLDVEKTVAVGVVEEMAIDALHPECEVNVFKVNCLAEFVLVVMIDFIALEREQIALAVFFEHGTKHPPVTMVVRKLGVRELRVELGGFFEKIYIAP
jgi:hypothetical protein